MPGRAKLLPGKESSDNHTLTVPMTDSAVTKLFQDTIKAAANLQVNSQLLAEGQGLLLVASSLNSARRQQLGLQARQAMEDLLPAQEPSASPPPEEEPINCQVTAEEKNQLFAFLHQD